MCIILGEVRSVSQTKLFVLANQDKTRQMTFYSNAVNTPEENMMILPVPNSSNSIHLHKIKYKEMFDDLKCSVKSNYQEPPSNLYTRSLAYASAERKPLEIISHGSYLVSIAPELEDLLRLDESVFDFPPELYNFFGKHYSSEFSYICCVLKPGLEAYEPLCYSHPLHSSGRLFVPTLHYHKHGGKVETNDADWDHLIYSVGTEEKANRGYTSRYYNNISWKHFPEEYQKLNVSSVRCAEIRGHSKNTDIAFALW
jgi:hypothetical protein